MYTDNIFRDMMRMQREMDKMFSRMFDTQGPMLSYEGQPKNELARSPVCDMCETENSYVAGIELPGVEKGDIQLDVTDSGITVKVAQKDEKKDDDSYSLSSQSYYRQISLPKNADAENAKASYKNGILRVEVPKRELKAKKRLQIE